MRKEFLFAGLGMVLGAGVLGLIAVNESQAEETVVFEDTPGPNLVIDVAGAATGQVVIDLLPNVAPQHVERMATLAEEGAYDGVVFHRVIDGFMAQTGDVEFGQAEGNTRRAGTGGSSYADLPAEFSNVPFQRGVVGMARSQNPNSANSQFFIMFDAAPHLNGQYTVVGRVIEGMDVVDSIQKGGGANGAVSNPDVMATVTVLEDDVENAATE
ncbi:peptidylprolyl isomerase [Cochlodiniinecator piscidefendens]|uniref:peptidylprolyl isomerase n=1 Tax=Cochlodiniinecator piscidefendens TaxID=2715756 RepID=UPI0014092C9A|nr:peptidylprolyl isomerase [Cochlodiniinecator piscidefendens]